ILTDYFKAFPKEERDKVKYFVSDMWKSYSNAADTWFKNATQIVDKYHWIRQVIWAFERIRKEEQKKLDSKLRRYFKRSRSLLIKRYDKLNKIEKQQVDVMLYYSVNISRAHWYKEAFLKILDCKDPSKAKSALVNWIHNAECCGLKAFENCALTMRNWFNGIVNSLSSPITNGFTEGCNNKIKVLKRNAYGYKNFSRFRNRILHIFSHQKLLKYQAVTSF
ncbi:MAG: ISL3 family transposase, partial [Acutalibacteraceae bacterium]